MPPILQIKLTRVPSAKALTNVEEGRESTPEPTRGTPRKASNLTAPPVSLPPADSVTSTLVTAIQAMEAKIAELVKQNEARVEEIIKHCETKVEDISKRYETQVTEAKRLEGQIAAMMELLRKTASRQAKTTQSWAKVVARAASQPSDNLTPPTSSPSIRTSSVSLDSSALNTINEARSAIILDLLNTTEKSNEIAQLKTAMNEALKKHEGTKETRCTGVQKRADGEHRIKLIFTSEEHE